MDRREFVSASAATIGLAPIFGIAALAEERAEVLYNGIRLPKPWPPRIDKLTLEPMPVPYLKLPPEVIPIDVGRQVFVDDFLIAETTLQRTYHKAEYHPATPILKPDQKWEQSKDPCAMVFSDGVWYDPADKLFKMWYMGGITRSTCYAVSQDGIRWEKPKLDVVKDTNIVHPGFRDSTTVWLDQEEKEPKRRFKLFRSIRHQKSWALSIHFSPDGIHWTEPGIISGPAGDRTTAFYNPFRKVWVYSLRSAPQTRSREYREHADVVEGSKWQEGEPVLWVGADRLDPARADLKTQPQLYNLDVAAYESILLGLFAIWRGQPADRAKPNELVLGYSRDGFHWHRPERQAFIPVSEKYGDWNWGNVQSAGGCCLVVGDQLYFYVSGRAGVRGSPTSGVCTTGLAVLRRDGFASMDAGEIEGALTTRPVTFHGKHLFVNADATGGELRTEALDRQGKVIPPFAAEKCEPVRANGAAQRVSWRGVENLAMLAGQAVQFRFHLTKGRLFSFWISREESGASHGYVAAGGPGFAGPMDDGKK